MPLYLVYARGPRGAQGWGRSRARSPRGACASRMGRFHRRLRLAAGCVQGLVSAPPIPTRDLCQRKASDPLPACPRPGSALSPLPRQSPLSPGSAHRLRRPPAPFRLPSPTITVRSASFRKSFHTIRSKAHSLVHRHTWEQGHRWWRGPETPASVLKMTSQPRPSMEMGSSPTLRSEYHKCLCQNGAGKPGAFSGCRLGQTLQRMCNPTQGTWRPVVPFPSCVRVLLFELPVFVRGIIPFYLFSGDVKGSYHPVGLL